MEKKEVIQTLLSNGAESVKGLKIKNVTVKPQENYVRLGITLDKPVKGKVSEDSVNYVDGETKVIFTSAFSVASLLKDNDDAAFAVNHILEHPNSMGVILSRATIDVIVEPVIKGQEYKNPWSDNAETTIVEHDNYYYHITNIQLSDLAIKALDKIAMSMLGV